MADSEYDFEAAHCGEAGHFIATVYCVAGIGDVFESYENRYVPADLPCHFQIE